MKYLRTRGISLLLAMAMLMTMLPTTALAADTVETAPESAVPEAAAAPEAVTAPEEGAEQGEVIEQNAIIRQEAIAEQDAGDTGFVIDADGKLTGYKGTDVEVVIPDTVKIIAKNAFAGNKTITKVTIPDSVTEIEAGTSYRTAANRGAFTSCTNLREVVFDGTPKLTEIGANTFYGCTSLESIAIPASVTAIMGPTATNIMFTGGAFENCTQLKSITFAESSRLKTIGIKAFNGCKAIENIAIPNTLETLGAQAFNGCTALTKVTLPDSLTDVGTQTFKGCTALTEVALPNKLVNLTNSFEGCTSLTSITLPETLKTLNGSFSGCTALTGVILPSGLTTIGASTFYNTGLTEITIPASVTAIGSSAFSATKLERVTIPATVTTLDARAFSGCSMKSIEFAEGCTLAAIPQYAFQNCTNLESVVIPESVTAVSNNAFEGCTSLASVTFGSKLTSIGASAFQGCSALTGVTLPDGLKSIGDMAFNKCTSLTAIAFPTSLETLGSSNYSSQAFGGCTALANITFPEGCKLTTLGARTFSGCTALESVVIPDSVTDTGIGTFSGCTALTSVTLPKNLETLNSSFSSCTALKSIALPDTLKTLNGSFDGCTALTGVTLPSGLTTIGASTFRKCAAISTLDIPDSVTAIGQYAFQGSGLTSFKWPAAVTTVSNSAFRGCDKLKTVTLPDAVTMIDQAAFYDCAALEEINWPASLATIGQNAFYGCTSLKSPVVLKNITVGTQAFAKCESLETVEIPESAALAMRAGSIFYGCTGLKKVTIESSTLNPASWGFPTDGTYTLEAPYNSPAHKFATANPSITFKGTGEMPEVKPEPNATVTFLIDNVHWFTVKYDENTNGTLTKYEGPGGKLTIPEGKNITAIGDSAFSTGLNNTLKITSIVIPKEITSIGEKAFYDSGVLESVTFEEGIELKELPASIFYLCDALTSITIPKSVETIGDSAFYLCKALTNIQFEEGTRLKTLSKGALAQSGLKTLHVPEGVTTIGDSFAISCPDLKEVSLPGTVTSLGSSSFYNCSSLTNVTFGEGIQIEALNGTFHQCTSLKEVTIPASVKTIGMSCFHNCPIEKIEFPETVETISHWAMYGCQNLKKVAILNDNITITGGQEFPATIFTIYGHAGSKAEEYTQSYDNISFSSNLAAFYGEVLEPGVVLITGDRRFDTATNLEGKDFPAGTLTAPGGEKAVKFQADTEEYDFYVNSGTEYLKFLVEVNQNEAAVGTALQYQVGNAEAASVAPSGNLVWTNIKVDLDEDNTDIKLILTPGKGDPRTYTFHIKKLKAAAFDDAALVVERKGYYEKGNKALSTAYYGTGSAYVYLEEQEYAVFDYKVLPGVTLSFADPDQAAADGHVIEKVGNVSTDDFSGRTVDLYRVKYKMIPVSERLGKDALKNQKRPAVIATKDGRNEIWECPSLVLRSGLPGVYSPDRLVEFEQGICTQYYADEPAAAIVLEAYDYWAHYVSLGGVGGYAIYQYDDPIKNDPNNPYGIDFFANGNCAGGAGCEPGAVQVSKDGVTWYYLAGQNHFERNTKQSVVPLRSGKYSYAIQVSSGEGYNGGSGLYTFGYVDSCAGVNKTAENGKFYASGEPRAPYLGNGTTGMDISWAVDDNGKPVYLDEISYIRIQTSIGSAGFGGASTEVGGIVRTDNYKQKDAVGVTDGLQSLNVCGVDILKDKGEKVGNNAEYHEITVKPMTVKVTADAVGAEDDNIYVNVNRYVGEAEYSSLFKEDGTRTVRILVQNGTKEPYMYLVNISGADPEGAAKSADLESVYVEPGDATVTPDKNDKLEYTVENSITAVKLTPAALNPEASVQVNGKALEEDGTSGSLPLEEGNNEFAVTVTSADGTATKTYTVTIIRKGKKTPTSDTIKITFTFTGDNIHYQMNEDDPYEEGTPIPERTHSSEQWIQTKTMTVPAGSSVKYVTDMMLLNAGIEFESTFGGTYIEAVKIPDGFEDAGKWLKEFTNGPKSGWMYRVNGKLPDVGYADRILVNGDKVEWLYTDDYTKETGYEGNWNSGGGGTVSADDQKAANAVIDQIKAIGDVTKDSGDKIKAARDAYDKLTEAQKKLVTNYGTLTDAERAYAGLTGKLPFTDINGHWAYDAIKYAYENSLFAGTSATTFGPNVSMNRAMLVTVLYRLDKEPSAATTSSFKDVPAGQWYTKAVAWASANKIVSGYNADTFGPTDTITREQMASILYRYAQYKGYDVSKTTDLAAFTDKASVSDWALTSMQWANAEKLINGRTATTLVPQGNATRAEVAQILMTFAENVAK